MFDNFLPIPNTESLPFYPLVLKLVVCVSLLCQGALQNSHCAALPGSIVAHASSGQFLCLLLADHGARLLRVAVADVMILLLFHFNSLGSLECEG